MITVRHLLVLSGALLLPGCSTLLPGTTLTLDSDDRVPAPEVAPELADVQTRVHIITPQFLAAQPTTVVVPPTPNPGLDADLAAYEYRVGAGDVITVTVWDHPEFQGGASTTPQFTAQQMAGTVPAPGLAGGAPVAGAAVTGVDTVRPQGLSLQVQRDGSVYFPFVGRVKVAGLTLPVIRDQLSRGLSRYIQSPQLDVAITAFRSQRVYLTGDIGRTGSLPITTEPLTLFDAIAMIGVSPTPDLEEVTLVRGGKSRVYSLTRLFRYGDASENVLLRQGDTLHFAKNNSRKVFMLGELLVKTGVVPIANDGLTLGAALAGAGGIDQLAANPKGVFVMRASQEGGKRFIDIYQLDVSQATAYVMADRFMLKQRDFVYVTAAPIVRFNRVMQQILPSVANLFFLTQLGGGN